MNSKQYKKEKCHPAIDLNAVKEKETFFNRINIVSTYLTDKYIHIFIYKNVGDRQKSKKKITTKTKPQQFSPNLKKKRRKKEKPNKSDEAFFSPLRKHEGHCTSSESNECGGHAPIPLTAIAAPRHTSALIL